MDRPCLLLFARPPKAEARRKGLLGSEALFTLAAQRVIAAAAACGFDLLVVGGHGREPAAGHLAQRGSDFGERLGNAIGDAAARGYRSMVVVPGDVPGFDRARLAAAARALGEGRLVFGPSPDGGVFLLGLPEGASPSLLTGVRWQTGAVFRDLVRRAGDCPVQVLDSLPDLDRTRDLGPLERAGASDPQLLALIRDIRSRRPARIPAELASPPGLFPSLTELLRGPPARA